MQTRIFHLQALSALHVGTGQGVGVVDLPIARAKATNLPIVPGSAIKGVLRDEAAAQFNFNGEDASALVKTLFGPDSSDSHSDTHAGALAFGDANLLVLPIRSFAGTLAYATCPFILNQYKRDTGIELKVPNFEGKAAVTGNSTLEIKGQVALEDLDIGAETSESIDNWAQEIAENLYPKGSFQASDWQTIFTERFVILPDDVFSFLADTATEVRTRIRIDRDTRIVKEGALWNEENLPAESVLWGVLGVAASRSQDRKTAEELAQYLPLDKEIKAQIGGKHTVGRGLCRMLLSAAK
ncbi:MAG: type III-B CRISPR module RAMP protein Cmr4 [Venatoribacter sp.]